MNLIMMVEDVQDKISKIKNCSFGFEIGNRESTSNEETLSQLILSQIEYYFSDINLKNDNFLKDEIKKHKKGFVDLRIFLKFKRIKWLFRTFLVEYDQQVETLSEIIEKSNELVLNKQKNMIKRKQLYKHKECDPDSEVLLNDNSIYLETLKPEINMSGIFKLFNNLFNIEKVQLPMNIDKTNKGFAVVTFVEYKSVAKAIEFIAEQKRKTSEYFINSEYRVVEYSKIKKSKSDFENVN